MSPLSQFLAAFLKSTTELTIGVVHQLYTNSSVIILGAGLAGGVHYFASAHHPLASAALDATFHGSVAVAKYVGLAFFIKTALTPVHEAFTRPAVRHDEYGEGQHVGHDHWDPKAAPRKDLINSHVVSYLTPIALAWIVAYSQGIPVKLAAATLYTVGTFALMKILDKGYDYALRYYDKSDRVAH